MEYCQMLRTVFFHAFTSCVPRLSARELPLTSEMPVFSVQLSHTCISLQHNNLSSFLSPTGMQSQGSTSSQPSFDSLSSSDSLLFSDSEQAEDDTDVFLTDSSPSVIIGGTGGATASGTGGSDSPGSQWTCDGFTDKEEEEDSYRSERGGKAAHISLGKTEATSQASKSQGDLLFAQKVREVMGQKRGER